MLSCIDKQQWIILEMPIDALFVSLLVKKLGAERRIKSLIQLDCLPEDYVHLRRDQ